MAVCGVSMHNLGTGGQRFDPAHISKQTTQSDLFCTTAYAEAKGLEFNTRATLAHRTKESKQTLVLEPNDWWKRPFDLTVLTAVHLLLAPVWLLLWTVIPLAIWLYDRGPVFYTQARLGKSGRVFRVFKFRSMIPNAEQRSGAVWAEVDDFRITPIGRFLRDRALDELPQVINMWKGDMSLVGPRSERPELAEQFTEAHPEFQRRLLVRPGLTGLAQVYGRYSTVPRNKLRYDTVYIRRMSPCLDARLLFMSVWITLVARWQAEER